MARVSLPSSSLFILIVAGCGSGGLNFWLYPEPRFAESEESVFVAYEGHQLLSIDGEDTALRCWGRRTAPEAYSRRDIPCRLHILPGPHTIVIHPRVSSHERVSLEFTALPGRVYGLDRSGCTASVGNLQETCLVKVVELENLAGGGEV